MQASETMHGEGPAAGPVDDATEKALAARVAELATAKGVLVATAESLTGGMVATALSSAQGASKWFVGSVVAYSEDVKRDLLGVPPGPVVSAQAASAMARGVRRVLGATAAIGVTGAGGPSGQDGREPGTVFLAFSALSAEGSDDHRIVRLLVEADDPEQVCATTTVAGLRMLAEGLERFNASDGVSGQR